jgi:hypothetical protein
MGLTHRLDGDRDLHILSGILNPFRQLFDFAFLSKLLPLTL